jgi:hypothetical protein
MIIYDCGERHGYDRRDFIYKSSNDLFNERHVNLRHIGQVTAACPVKPMALHFLKVLKFILEL